MFVPRRVYERIGVYDSSMRYLGDYDFMYRAVNVHKLDVIYVPEPVAFYREGGCSDRHIAGCLRDELKVKLRYGQNRGQGENRIFSEVNQESAANPACKMMKRGYINRMYVIE